MTENEIHARLQHMVGSSDGSVLPNLSTSPYNSKVLKKGEQVYYTDLRQWKTGDGVTTIANLPFDKAEAKNDISWKSAAGGTSVGWINIAQIQLGTNNHISGIEFVLHVFRAYTAPSTEDYIFSITTGWNNPNITQINGSGGTRMIEKFRFALDTTNHILYLQMYVNTSFTTYTNEVQLSLTHRSNASKNIVPITGGAVAGTYNNYYGELETSIQYPFVGKGVYCNASNGMAPLKVNSTTQVNNLNADLLDGRHANAFTLVDGSNATSAGVSAMINKLSVGNSTPSDSDYYVSQYANGGTTTTTYYRRPMSALWNYIKSKADAIYAAVSHTHVKSDVGLSNVDNTADVNKVVKSAKYIHLSTYTPTDNTVAGHKAGLATAVASQEYGVGYPIVIGQSIILHWDDDSATYYPSSVYAMTKIGGGYSGGTYGQWLLSSYNQESVGVVGRTNSTWSSIRWLAFITDNVASATKLLHARTINGVAFDGSSNITITANASDVYAWAKAPTKPSYTASEIGLGNVENLNQSKAIKSITRSGTTFTATALDGTTTTFTQQDNDTTYSPATTTVNGLMSAADKTKLNGIEAGANRTVVDTAMSSTSTNPVQNKVVNTVLSNKVDKVSGKGLSTNDYTTAEKNKLGGIAAGAEVNVQADWSETNTSSDSFIKNKPTISNDFTDAYKTKLDGIEAGANMTIVDTTMSNTSTNPVQNKVISSKIASMLLINGSNATAAGLNTIVSKATVNDVDLYKDADYLLVQSTTNNITNRKSLLRLWDYIKSKADTVYAVLNSPSFTGIPTAPTATDGTDTSQIATTAFTTQAVSKLKTDFVLRSTCLAEFNTATLIAQPFLLSIADSDLCKKYEFNVRNVITSSTIDTEVSAISNVVSWFSSHSFVVVIVIHGSMSGGGTNMQPVLKTKLQQAGMTVRSGSTTGGSTCNFTLTITRSGSAFIKYDAYA